VRERRSGEGEKGKEKKRKEKIGKKGKKEVRKENLRKRPEGREREKSRWPRKMKMERAQKQKTPTKSRQRAWTFPALHTHSRAFSSFRISNDHQSAKLHHSHAVAHSPTFFFTFFELNRCQPFSCPFLSSFSPFSCRSSTGYGGLQDRHSRSLPRHFLSSVQMREQRNRSDERQ
jgi:hypothetical protein